jgi:hypothetical protein
MGAAWGFNWEETTWEGLCYVLDTGEVLSSERPVGNDRQGGPSPGEKLSALAP